MKLDQFKQRLLLVAFIVLGVIALPVTVYLVQQQQSIRQNASSAKSLTLTPSSQNAKVGDTVKYDIILHPNGVAVKYVNLVINYDSTKLTAKTGSFVKNPAFDFNPKTKKFSDGQIVLEFQTADLAKYITKEIVIGSISFRALDITSGLVSNIKFGNVKTIVKGADGKILSYEFNNASVTITDGTAVCPVDNATCSWSPVDNATNYNYKVTDKTTNSEVKSGVIADTKISFDSIPGHTYACAVSAANDCGSGTEGTATATCISLTPTPTLSITPTVTPTGIITITETVTPTESLTPTLTPTGTVTLTPTLTPTSTPTSTPTVTPTNIPTPTRVPTATPITFTATGTITPTTFVPTAGTDLRTPSVPGVVLTATPTNVPAPLPPTGSNTFTLGAILGTALVILGGLLLLVF